MEIDFETINEELEEFSVSQDFEFNKNINEIQHKMILVKGINIKPFLEASENFEIVDRQTAKQCLSMSLQARKMRQALDKKRAEIIRPYLNYQKSVNKFAKELELRLTEIEKSLTEKLKDYMKGNSNNRQLDFINQSMNVEDGNVSKSQIWKYEIEDASLVPREYLCIDEKKIKSAINAGIRRIPGLIIEESEDFKLRVKN
jgi:hypothetical protein